MRVLWVSDSPDTPSGFGNVTRFICEALARRGHQVHILGWQTRAAGEWNGCKLHPTASHNLGTDVLYPLVVRLRPEVVITLADVWWLPHLASPHLRQQMELLDTPWVLYFPIDGDLGNDRLPASWIEMLAAVDFPVAMSRYGQRVAQACGITADYIPHGVDLQVFRQPGSREEAKERAGYGGKFVVLSDSRNQPRKLLPRLLDTFAAFAADKPDAVLHLHTDPDDEFTESYVYSYNVRADIQHLGLKDRVKFSPNFRLERGKGLPLNELAAYYQAADIHLLASSGEGFGLPTLQAAAAGAVPLASAYSASEELTSGHGESLPIADWTANEFGIRRCLIDVPAAAQIMTRYYRDRNLLRERSLASERFAQAYGWERIGAQWDNLLTSISRRRQRVRHIPQAKTEVLNTVGAMPVGRGSGISVSVKVIGREFGRLEASILSDARGKSSDVRIPTLPKFCEVGKVSVPRRTGYVGVGAGSGEMFAQLREIFPILNGWMPELSPGETEREAGIEKRAAEPPEGLRYDVAQSVLMLDVAGVFSDNTLRDAALYGVPCIGAMGRPLQSMLWPSLVASSAKTAVSLGRQLLTDAALMKRVCDFARETCLREFMPDEQDSALWLREIHAARRAAPAARQGVS